MAIGDIYETGRNSKYYAGYVWISYADGTQEPEPQEHELRITLRTGEILPGITSSGKESLWKMTAYIY
jgi:hypothetical protein